MARSLRIEYPGAFYHVMARGNRRQAIFHGDDDWRFFLQTLGEACGRTGWRVHAWVLMGNHYHLFIETPEANLVAGMGWLQNTLTRRYNTRHRKWGRLFGDRYKAIVVQGEDDYHYRTLMDYIHLNPVRAKWVRMEERGSVADYAWSSLAGGYLLAPSRRPKWLAASVGLGRFELEDTAAGRRALVERLDRKAAEEEAIRCGVPEVPEETDGRRSHLRRGWYWGTPEFAEKLEELVEKGLSATARRSRAYERTVEGRSHGLTQAVRWIKEWLESCGLSEEELRELKSGDGRKRGLALLLWKHTTVSQQWLADRLGMKSAANVSQQLRRSEVGQVAKSLPPELRKILARGSGE
jgi:putative transposase